MQVMKLADPGIAGFRHFHEHQRRDGLHLIRGQMIEGSGTSAAATSRRYPWGQARAFPSARTSHAESCGCAGSRALAAGRILFDLDGGPETRRIRFFRWR